MKMFSLLALLISAPVMAASDSVGVFYRPEKVVVLVNERGEEADLQNLIRRLGAGKNSFQSISQDKTIKVVCGKSEIEASCTFTFFPGSNVTINSNRSVEAQTTLEDLGIALVDDISVGYESSMGDKFTLEVANGNIHFLGSKKILK
ncbi:hypothetical protein DOM21_18090 [Bacteriovorax stolpii]|uniref:Uncharacterized protein n=1 Tax=Bacteriovorax stolpii TaxID=960 RepID=A0A2K9NMK9_BACTC|nr:hypothetical protein [Bacteriovorax stolpii]AUN96743.1 hypothetical protein C0V70_01185 [Bacteriovorax stolpii]QDK43326.1 hypothetical protein DOM21_18090 [Bacteriovorax stolpii]TDP53734.1 hypothetical protein C8D79_1010 [Bacteriovorax stolpii]